MYNGKRQPKTQFEIVTGKQQSEQDVQNRANNVQLDKDYNKELKIGLYDIDSVIKYYFDNTIKPSVTENGVEIPVPVIYGSPEKWKSVKRDGYYRDKQGKIQCPLIAFRRTGIEKNRNLSNKVDANFPQVYYKQEVKYSQQNKYDAFSALNNIQPAKNYVNIIVPEYLNITYDLVVWTDYVEHMNGILESILYSEGSFWGDQERFKFRTKIDNITNVTDLQSDNDRLVRSTFTMTLFGYIVPDALVKKLSKHRKERSVSQTQITNIAVLGESTTEYVPNISGSL